MNPFIYGKDPTARIVSIEADGNELKIFTESPTGQVRMETRSVKPWALSPKAYGPEWKRLKGNNYFKYRRDYRNRFALSDDYERHKDLMVIWDSRESANLDLGITYFKDMRLSDVSILSFDIESTGIEHGSDSKVLLISNTFRRGRYVERKLFAFDQYDSEAGMFDAWSEWVRECNPSIITGHNIFMYDLPYMAFCAAKAGTTLSIGRDGSPIRFNKKESKYRRDGSQDYYYRNANIFGREIVDTFFLAFKYDFSRKYESYALKQIIKQEGLERADRQHYDASKIGSNYNNPSEWRKIKAYAEHDADDALALFDLMAPAYFYLAQSLPKPFQTIVNSASGAWLNSFLVRSYIEAGHSVPKASEPEQFEGAISIGNPGIFHNVFKVDVASLYPSIMLQYEVSDKEKDPLGSFHRMVSHFTNQRLENKKLAKETGDRHYSDLEQAQKIFINSAYGMLGTPGLHFNSPTNAAFVTREGRRLLQMAIDWSASNGFQLVNADTDSISICREEGLGDFTKNWVLDTLNGMSPARIRWEDDGIYDAVLVLKAKNYILRQGAKVKTKGSALKATLKEPALREFIDRLVHLLLDGRVSSAPELYRSYVNEIVSLQDIRRWSFKKTITESVLNPSRTNEEKVLAALTETDIQMGDKVYLYFDTNDQLKRVEDWKGDHCVPTLLEKLYKTVKIFESVLDTKQFPNLALKGRGRGRPTPLQLYLNTKTCA